MGKVTVYCLISACTPEIVDTLLAKYSTAGLYGPLLTQALKDLADEHEILSQNDLSVIGSIHESGEPYPSPHGTIYYESSEDYMSALPPNFCPEKEVRVQPDCTMGESWEFGFVEGPVRLNEEEDRTYLVSFGNLLMAQTHAMDILELATEGRMTPLRLWRLAMRKPSVPGQPRCFANIDYGEVTGEWEQFPDTFPGLRNDEEEEEEVLNKLEELGDVDLVKQHLVHKGKFWIWMAPDRFPVSTTIHDSPAPNLPEICLCAESHTPLERLPMEILICIASSLPLSSLVNLASTSRLLRTSIFGNEYLARVWVHTTAPFWIPVPTRTPRLADAIPTLPYPATQPSPPRNEKAERYPTPVVDWSYIRRCTRSGSMRNRQRIWNTVLDIERLADLSGE